MAESSLFLQAQEALTYIARSLPDSLQKPQFVIICGSGLGGLSNAIHETPRREFDYASIPNFPQPTVVGHAGKLVFGLLGPNIPVVLMVGRSHYYEGHTISNITFPIRLFKLMGVETIVGARNNHQILLFAGD